MAVDGSRRQRLWRGAEGGPSAFWSRGSASASCRVRAASPEARDGSAQPGIDAFEGNGDKDGYRNLSGRVRGMWGSPLQFALAPLALR